MRSLLFGALVLSTSLAMVSCSTDKEIVYGEEGFQGLSTTEAFELTSAIKQGQNIEKLIAQQNILTGSSYRDKANITAAVKRSLSALRGLKVSPNNKNFVVILLQEVGVFNNAQTEVRDGDTLPRYFDLVAKVGFRAAKNLGVDAGDVTWRSYFNEFIGSLNEFTVYNDGASWGLNARDEESMVGASGSAGASWLISPTFDLSEVGKANVTVSHRINIQKDSQYTGPFNFVEARNGIFKVLVSTDYVKGDPNDANWKLVKADKFPSGSDFHTITSSFSLEEFANEKVAVAFKFDLERFGNQVFRTSWDVLDFTMNAQGVFSKVVKREVPKSLFKEGFDKDLGKFKSLGMPEWEFGNMGGNEYVKVTSEASGTSSLISPLFTLKNASEVELIINNIGNNLDSKNLKMEISYDYKGGDINKATWTEVDLGLEDTKYSRWAQFAAKLKLDKAQYEKSFVLKFKLDTTEANQVWEINSIEFQAKDGEATAEEIKDAVDSTAPVDTFKEVTAYSISDNFKNELVKTTTCQNSRSGKDMTVIFNKTKDKKVSFNTHSCKEKEEKLNLLVTDSLTAIDAANGVLRINQAVTHANPTKLRAAAIYVVPATVATATEAEELINNGKAQKLNADLNNKKLDIELSEISEKSFKLAFAYKPFKEGDRFQYFTWTLDSVQIGEK